MIIVETRNKKQTNPFETIHQETNQGHISLCTVTLRGKYKHVSNHVYVTHFLYIFIARKWRFLFLNIHNKCLIITANQPSMHNDCLYITFSYQTNSKFYVAAKLF